MANEKPLHAGQVRIIRAGKYAGQGCQVRHVGPVWVAVLIAGRVHKLKRESLEGGAHG